MTSRPALLLIAVLGAVGASGDAVTTDSPPPVKTSLEERVQVQLVQLNFTATDRKGRPVGDLTAADVDITEKGRSRRIAFLQPYYTGGGAAVEPTTARPPDAPATASGPTVSPGRWLVLVIDNYASTQPTKFRAVQAAQKFLAEGLAPGVRVAIVAFTGKIEVVQGFTTDVLKLKGALDRLSGTLDKAVEDRFGAIESLLDEMQACKSSSSPISCAQHLSDAYQDEKGREADAFLVALTQLTNSLAPIPDLKAVVLVSEGFARTPSSDTMDVARVVLGLSTAMALNISGDDRVNASFDEMAKAAARARVSFFTINPGGGSRGSGTDARRGSPLGGTTDGDQIDVFRRSGENYQQGLVELARRTGGTATQNPNVVEALNNVVDLSAGLYTVGYYLADDDALFSTHDVKIRVKRKGVQVDTRREVPMTADPPSLLGDLTVAPDPCSDKGRRIAVVRLHLDRSRLMFEKVGKKMASNFSVYLRVLAEGRSTPIYDDYRFLNITHTVEEMSKGNIPDPVIEETLLVPCDALTVAVAATDTGSGAHAEFTAHVPP